MVQVEISLAQLVVLLRNKSIKKDEFLKMLKLYSVEEKDKFISDFAVEEEASVNEDDFEKFDFDKEDL